MARARSFRSRELANDFFFWEGLTPLSLELSRRASGYGEFVFIVVSLARWGWRFRDCAGTSWPVFVTTQTQKLQIVVKTGFLERYLVENPALNLAQRLCLGLGWIFPLSD